MKFRQVFTVTRSFNEKDVRTAKRDFQSLKDEGGEYLYGSGGQETIDVKLQKYDKGNWVTVDIEFNV